MTKASPERLQFVEDQMRIVAREDLGIELGDEIDEETFNKLVQAILARRLKAEEAQGRA